ncbi:hypothetical protein [Halorarius halobius]|uniref:hypothetical protein n=1 Tax=Halorarius halobius TaxID=2962671 RepID=UPI0020CBF7D7|nr:hypothetical protein [Halorarius halobius]
MPVTEPLGALDDDVIAAVADDAGEDTERLRDALERHQEHARSLPGIEELVYDWRRSLPYDPLVHREPTAYYLVFQQSVWTEFADQLGLDEPLSTAVQSVHDRQTRRALARAGVDVAVVDGGAAMVLGR